MKTPLPEIIIDTREQLPYDFGDNPVRFQKLEVGDYSLVGLESLVVCERKRHTELASCLGTQRERFLAEIERGSELKRLHVIVEASFKGVMEGLYDDWGSKMHPNSIRGTIAAWSNRYEWLRWHFASDRELAQDWCWCLLKSGWKEFGDGQAK